LDEDVECIGLPHHMDKWRVLVNTVV
jgi:hypothetical protein